MFYKEKLSISKIQETFFCSSCLKYIRIWSTFCQNIMSVPRYPSWSIEPIDIDRDIDKDIFLVITKALLILLSEKERTIEPSPGAFRLSLRSLTGKVRGMDCPLLDRVLTSPRRWLCRHWYFLWFIRLMCAVKTRRFFSFISCRLSAKFVQVLTLLFRIYFF